MAGGVGEVFKVRGRVGIIPAVNVTPPGPALRAPTSGWPMVMIEPLSKVEAPAQMVAIRSCWACTFRAQAATTAVISIVFIDVLIGFVFSLFVLSKASS
jgi:hypothetical protein